MNKTSTRQTVRTVAMPTEEEIREYLLDHIEKFSLLEFVDWIFERNEN